MKRLIGLVAMIGLSVAPARGSIFFAPDVPTGLSGATYMPWSVIRRDDAGAYSLALSLPAGTPVDALYLMSSGDWLVSVESPSDLGGKVYDPRSVVRFDGTGAYSLFFDGAAAGIPAGSNVDAAFLDGGDAGDLILSFDVPTTIGAATYEPSDLVRVSGGVFTLFFDGSATVPPIPISTNVTGAGHRGTRTFLTFDVPTTLGAATYLPGQIVTWDGTSFALFFSDAAWSPGSRMSALALGSCLDGDADGYGQPGDASCPAGGLTDCRDTNVTVYPGAPQLCDGINNDCADPSWPTMPPNEADADGDGSRICAGDCLDSNSTVYPGARQVCDGINNDCNDPTWPVEPPDADADGHVVCGDDCDDSNGSVWGTPGEVVGLTVAQSGILNWNPPASLGGLGPSLLYDTIRTRIRSDFVSIPLAACVESDDGPNTTATDPATPPVGQAFYYLIRAQNACPGALGNGSLGTTSSGATRTARDCP